MYKLIEFIRRIYVVLLFIVIEAIALNYYAHSSYYTQAKILSHANRVTGGVQSAIFGVRHYFTLRHENELLSERIADLEMELAVYREQVAAAGIDSLQPHIDELSQYRYTTARIVSNSIARDRNYITLNRGIMHGVTENMAVISPDGVMVGYVIGCSERYSVVMPLLNIDFRTSGKIAGDDHFGSISWGGGSPYKMEMTELSKYADIEVGDEVVSSGLSHYFPEGVKIGYVESYSLNDTQTAYDVVIRLAADVTKISNVIVIENLDYGEVSHLEDSATGGAAAAQ
ncbi:rod shape-determining protein MreC [Alistipes sp. Z76]|nr:rod shape-determining protein MreC [Alistipes sp. Z76]NCE68491.1 rod shape-determining protein MreC [Muribaculaceae bacterium M3]